MAKKSSYSAEPGIYLLNEPIFGEQTEHERAKEIYLDTTRPWDSLSEEEKILLNNNFPRIPSSEKGRYRFGEKSFGDLKRGTVNYFEGLSGSGHTESEPELKKEPALKPPVKPTNKVLKIIVWIVIVLILIVIAFATCGIGLAVAYYLWDRNRKSKKTMAAIQETAPEPEPEPELVED